MDSLKGKIVLIILNGARDAFPQFRKNRKKHLWHRFFQQSLRRLSGGLDCDAGQWTDSRT